MAQHLFLIDPIEKLNPKKDSSLFMANTAFELGHEVFYLFKEDLQFSNHDVIELSVLPFNQKERSKIRLTPQITIHMRLDPPFDYHYLQVLWLLSSYERIGVTVTNSPRAILNFHEKLYAYEQGAIETSIVLQEGQALNFLKTLQSKGYNEIILKPLNQFQGIGVVKVKISDALLPIQMKLREEGMVIIQPYLKEIHEGETRALYFRGEFLGALLKHPPLDGSSFITNIAAGGSYEATELSVAQKAICNDLSMKLLPIGGDLIAFDLIGDKISEVNLTCPGLLVEASHALGMNLACTMFN